MENQQTFSIIGNRRNKSAVEKAAQGIFTLCAFIAILAVVSITVYMVINGTPALFSVGIKEILHLDLFNNKMYIIHICNNNLSIMIKLFMLMDLIQEVKQCFDQILKMYVIECKLI